MWAVWWMVGGGVMADMAEGVIVATWMLLAMLAPAGLLWATMRAYDLIADHRDRQRRRRVRRAMRQATYVDLIEWAQERRAS
jgi:hypothetical protein